MPIGITNIGWKMYMVNGGWDVIVIILIVSPLTQIRCNPADFNRPYTGLKPKARLWKKLMLSLTDINTLMCPMWKPFVAEVRRSTSMF